MAAPSLPRAYQAAYSRTDGGFVLYAEYGDEWAVVPEAAHVVFRTEAEALAFAEELERPEPDEDPNNTFRSDDFAGFAENH